MRRSEYKPYKYWTEEELREKLIFMCDSIGLPIEVYHVVNEAFISDNWDVLNDYNGCTAVQDLHHPSLSCFVHDYLWISGQGGKEADYIFYHLMLLEGYRKSQAKRRWFAVRAVWMFYFRWKYILNGKTHPYTDNFNNLIHTFKATYK